MLMDVPQLESVGELKVRSYQAEMLDRSLEGNVIVAMDTGSGKTAVAVLRIQVELDRCSSEKLVWFLAPTVALCTQQHDYLHSYLPAIKTLLLTGADNVDRWSEQRIWDSVLEGIRVVVSTHAILADALSHGFIAMRRLALIIFDEAHSCVRGHPANVIMQKFYHPIKARSGEVPHILGLSASPILRSNLKELGTIETNLDSVCITPRLHRQDLLTYVHHPTLQRLEYPPCVAQGTAKFSYVFESLRKLSQRLLLKLGSPRSSLSLGPEFGRTGRSNRQGILTELSDQARGFCNKAAHIHEELGPSAAAYFIIRTAEVLRNKAELAKASAFHVQKDELVHQLRDAFDQEGITQSPDVMSLRDHCSPKVERLIAFLVRQEPQTCSCLIFVQQRAAVSVLHTILASHPRTMLKFRCATFVGSSSSAHGKLVLSELYDKEAQKSTISDFRKGKKNIIIATDALEEGIDVAACNLVICFNTPASLKSYIQRRGRARMQASQYVIMVPTKVIPTNLNSWPVLENALIKMYQDADRERTEAAESERGHESVHDRLHVEATGACLTAEKAVAHLYHFCNVMPRQRYTETRPEFSFEESRSGSIICTVTLPNFVRSSLRSTRGRRAWRTEKAAMKDAAFQCYTALYKAKLLNDHLLPLTRDWNDHNVYTEQLVETTARGKRVQPFDQMAQAWADPELHQTTVTVRCSQTDEELSLKLTTSGRLSEIPDTSLYWDSTTTFDASFRHQTRSLASLCMLEELRAATQLLDRSTHSDQIPSNKSDFVLLFSPNVKDDDLRDWLRAHQGRVDMLAALSSGVRNFQGLIRSTRFSGTPFVFSGNPHELAKENDPEIMCSPLFKRRNFEAPNTLTDRGNATPTAHSVPTPTAVRLRASDCTVDLLDYRFARFNLFVPSLLRHIEVVTVANQLQETILRDVRFRDLIHIVTAISAPSARRATNYQRYEFFGDALLKFQTSVQLFVDHGNWPEGYLSQRKDSIVSNVRLARAAVALELDSYVLMDPLRRKWSAPRISDALQQADGRRLSTKTLADVVEALIGAAYMDSGFEAARTCSNVFLPEISALAPQISQPVLRQTKSPEELELETMIGYRFRDASLLREALTHPSCGVDASTESYQRLEFLGDAVLDVVIFTHLSRCLPELSQGQMTCIKAALANRNFLGYLCLRCGLDRSLIRVENGPAHNLQQVSYHERVSLWQFMRHHSLEVAHAQQRVVQSDGLYGSEIQTCLSEGAAYPWRLLARLDLDKFYSDIIESIFGAMFIDSGGDLSVCQDFFKRVGLMLYAARMVEGSMHVLHPRDELQRLVESSKINLTFEKEQLGAECPAFRCTVTFDEERIVESQACVTKEEAYMEGAQAAVEFLRSEHGGILI